MHNFFKKSVTFQKKKNPSFPVMFLCHRVIYFLVFCKAGRENIFNDEFTSTFLCFSFQSTSDTVSTLVQFPFISMELYKRANLDCTLLMNVGFYPSLWAEYYSARF